MLLIGKCFLLKCNVFFFSSRRRHTRWPRDWSSDVCSSDLGERSAFGERVDDLELLDAKSGLEILGIQPSTARDQGGGHQNIRINERRCAHGFPRASTDVRRSSPLHAATCSRFLWPLPTTYP